MACSFLGEGLSCLTEGRTRQYALKPGTFLRGLASVEPSATENNTPVHNLMREKTLGFILFCILR
jgi:hypothetical protein